MKRYTIIYLLLMAAGVNAFGQSDSLTLSGELGLQGRLQTGNLQQFALNPSGQLRLNSRRLHAHFQASYQYLNVSNFTIMSDFWSTLLLSHRTSKNVFPAFISSYGFAKSYQIDRSLLVSPGLGWNVINDTHKNSLQLYGFAGYLNLKYHEHVAIETLSFGGLIKASLPLTTNIGIIWTLHTYHPLNNSSLWGFNNLILFQYHISPVISLQASHNTIYNSETITDISNTNTVMMFGMAYKSK